MSEYAITLSTMISASRGWIRHTSEAIQMRALSLFVIFSLVSPAVIGSTVTYTYTGNPFTFIVDGSISGSYDTTMSVSATFTIAAPLTPMAFTDISGSVLSYSVSDGRGTLDETNSAITALAVAVDSSGQITTWNFGVGTPGLSIQHGVGTTGSGTGTGFDLAGIFDCSAQDGTCDYATHDEASVLDNPGNWAGPPAVPLPASAILLASGLAGLAGLRIRRSVVTRHTQTSRHD